MGFQRLDRVGSGLLGGIEEGKIAQQHHVALVLHAEGSHRGRVAFLRNGKHPEALVVEGIHGFENTAADSIGQRLHSAVALGIGADGEHFLHGTLGHHLGLAGLVLHHRGQSAAGEVEGDLIHLHIVFRQVEKPRVCRLFILRLADDGNIHQVFVTGLEVAVEVGMAQHPCIVLAIDIQVVFQHHLVLCQRAGFVSAENVDSAEVLNGVKIFDDGLLFAHGNSALSKAGGHDHG